MGELHLEVIVDRLLREYRVGANIGRPQVSYRERPRREATGRGRFVRQTGGRGQYGDVTVELEPLPLGTGVQIERRIVGGAIPTQFVPAAERGAARRLSSGPQGMEVTDVRITLVDGSSHEVDSSELAFEIAGAMAVEHALTQARTDVMEPVMGVQVVVPEAYVGDTLAGLAAKRGTIHGADMRGGSHIITAEVPLATMFGYANEVAFGDSGSRDVFNGIFPLRGYPTNGRRGRVADTGFVKPRTRRSTGANGTPTLRTNQAARQCRHDRPCRPRQDHVDGRYYESPLV